MVKLNIINCTINNYTELKNSSHELHYIKKQFRRTELHYFFSNKLNWTELHWTALHYNMN